MIGNWSHFEVAEHGVKALRADRELRRNGAGDSFDRRSEYRRWSAHRRIRSPPPPHRYHHSHPPPSSSSHHHLHTVDHIPTKPMTSILCNKQRPRYVSNPSPIHLYHHQPQSPSSHSRTHSHLPNQFQSHHTRETHKTPNHKFVNIHENQFETTKTRYRPSQFRDHQNSINPIYGTHSPPHLPIGETNNQRPHRRSDRNAAHGFPEKARTQRRARRVEQHVPSDSSGSDDSTQNHRHRNLVESETDEEVEALNLNEPRYVHKRHHHNSRSHDYKLKLDIPSFDGHMHIEEFLDWIKSVETFFECTEIPEEKQVKTVVYKIKGGASAWWEQLQTHRRREGKRSIRSWPRMRQLLKGRFLPTDYDQILYQQYQRKLVNVVDDPDFEQDDEPFDSDEEEGEGEESFTSSRSSTARMLGRKLECAEYGKANESLELFDRSLLDAIVCDNVHFAEPMNDYCAEKHYKTVPKHKPTLPKGRSTTLVDMMQFVSDWFIFEEGENDCCDVLGDIIVDCDNSVQEKGNHEQIGSQSMDNSQSVIRNVTEGEPVLLRSENNVNNLSKIREAFESDGEQYGSKLVGDLRLQDKQVAKGESVMPEGENHNGEGFDTSDAQVGNKLVVLKLPSRKLTKTEAVLEEKEKNDKYLCNIRKGFNVDVRNGSKVVSTLGFGFKNVKIKGVRRRQWQIAWTFLACRWMIVLVPLWVCDALRRDFSVGVYHSHKPNRGLRFVVILLVHFPRVSTELEVEFFFKERVTDAGRFCIGLGQWAWASIKF